MNASPAVFGVIAARCLGCVARVVSVRYGALDGWDDLVYAIFSFPDLKADEKGMCTLPEATGSAPQEIDPSKENQLLFTYSVHWEVREKREAGWQLGSPTQH